MYQPIERRLERSKATLPPIDRRDIVLFRRLAAICCRGHVNIPAALQSEGKLDALRPRHDEFLKLRAPREGD